MKKRESLSPSPKKSGILKREKQSSSSSNLKKSPEDKSSPQSSPRKHSLRQLICSKISPSSPSPSRSITFSHTSQSSGSSKDDTSPIGEEKIFGLCASPQQTVSSRALPSPPSPSRSTTRSYTSQSSGSSKGDVSPIRDETIFGSYVSHSPQTVSSRALPSPSSPSRSITRSYASSYTSDPFGSLKGDASPIREGKIFGSYVSHSQQTVSSRALPSPPSPSRSLTRSYASSYTSQPSGSSYVSHSRQTGTVSPQAPQHPWVTKLIGTVPVTSPTPPQSPQKRDPGASSSPSTGGTFRSYTLPKPWNPVDPGFPNEASIRQEQLMQSYTSSSSSYTSNLGQTMSLRSPTKGSPKKIGFSIDASLRQEQAIQSYTSSSSSYISNLGQTMSSLSPKKTSPKKIGISGTVLSNSPSPSGGKFRSYTTQRPWSPNLPGSPQYSEFDEFAVESSLNLNYKQTGSAVTGPPKPTQNPWNFQQMESALPLSPSRSVFGSGVQRPQSLGLNFSEASTSSSELQRMQSSLFSNTQKASPESPPGSMYYETTHFRRSPRRLESPSRTSFSYSDIDPTVRSPRRQALTFYEPEEEDTDLINKSFLIHEDYD